MGSAAKGTSKIIEEIRKSDCGKVKVAVTDMDGILRGKYIHKEKFLKSAEGGFGFCNVVFGWDCADVVYDNVNYTGWHTGYPDAHAMLDINTYRKVPWDNDVPLILADFVDGQGAPLSICPRQIAKAAMEKASGLGFVPKLGMEFEWFNFRETPQSLEDKGHQNLNPLTPGMFGYSLLRPAVNGGYFNALMDDLDAFGVPLEGLHTETGPGVYEGALMCCDGIEAADRAVLFKMAVKEIAYRYDIIASFMARWNTSLPGCSGHLHQSLIRKSDGTNAFWDAGDSRKMSDTFKSYLAGQMRCLPEILPMFAPNINSYKRLVEGFWAPTRVLWGLDNRTVAFRVIAGGEKATRLETRVGGSDLNPYLAVAAAVASGIYGIENKLTLDQEPLSGNGYESKTGAKLPSSLLEATERFHGSEIARSLFGDDFVEHFAKTREWECRQFQQSVTDWEMKRYFELV